MRLVLPAAQRAAAVTLFAAGCAQAGAPSPQSSAAMPAGSATAPAFARAAPTPSATISVEAAPGAAPSASAAPAEPTVAVPDVTAAPSAAPVNGSSPAGSSQAAPAGPLPNVEVRNVGMHIGGNDPHANDAANKRPIRDAVKPHYDELRACYGKAEKPGKAATFGVDMRIPGEGGRAEISHSRTSLKGAGLVECMVGVFEKVEFPRPAKGVTTMVSFSVEFKRK